MSAMPRHLIARALRAASRLPAARGRIVLSDLADILEQRSSPRVVFAARALGLLATARRHDFAPIAERLHDLCNTSDALFPARLASLRADLAGMLPTGRTASEAAWLRILGAALAEGLVREQRGQICAAEGDGAAALNFPEPMLFEQAMRTATERELIATPLSSAELRALGADLLRGAVFSARTTDARYVQAIKYVVEDMLAGKINRASASAVLQDMLAQLGYTAEAGFAGDREAGVPPAERGSLRDLGSETRIDLILDTQTRMMTGAGYRIAGQEPARLYQFPCWELVRVAARMVPRGSAESHTEGWPARWRELGADLFGGRMIARKDAPIWDQLGDPSLFDDGLGNPYPPFAFNSGMGVREVARGDAEALGVLDARTRVAEMPVDLARHFRDEAKNFDPEVLAELKKEADIILEENRQKSTLEIALERRRASYGIHKAGGAQ